MDGGQEVMRRASFEHDGVRLSYLDAGGEGVPVIALHAYWMEAGTYADLAAAWRLNGGLSRSTSADTATATSPMICRGTPSSAISARSSTISG